jgi:endonuclease YncB( thermonuclease family)
VLSAAALTVAATVGAAVPAAAVPSAIAPAAVVTGTAQPARTVGRVSRVIDGDTVWVTDDRGSRVKVTHNPSGRGFEPTRPTV